ncbi:MAG TPA: hypothetical protein VFY04_00415 [Solirubrobacterales bacterium]|nr:hypothetical protein [Solirubrobacterales bacterium]
MIYHAIGKAVVKYTTFYLRQRYARPMRIGGGLAAIGLGVALYLASRNVPEG